jgi:hypothetical protein
MVAVAVELLVPYLVECLAIVLLKLQGASEAVNQEDKGQDMLVTGHAPLLAEANLILARFRLEMELHVVAVAAAEIPHLVPFQLSNAVAVPDVAEGLV